MFKKVWIYLFLNRQLESVHDISPSVGFVSGLSYPLTSGVWVPGDRYFNLCSLRSKGITYWTQEYPRLRSRVKSDFFDLGRKISRCVLPVLTPRKWNFLHHSTFSFEVSISLKTSQMLPSFGHVTLPLQSFKVFHKHALIYCCNADHLSRKLTLKWAIIY